MTQSRSPRGERGLKYGRYTRSDIGIWSLPSRGAWIEIITQFFVSIGETSLPSRGAWIEIFGLTLIAQKKDVAPLAGSVD